MSLLLLIGAPVYAVSVTGFADSIILPILAIGDLLEYACFAAGIGFVGYGFVKFHERRRGKDVSLGFIVFIITFGLALMAVLLLPEPPVR